MADPTSANPETQTRPASVPRKTVLERLPIWLRWLRHRLSMGIGSLPDGIDHAGVFAEVQDDGKLGVRYLFMIVMAAAIATLGLLLSSPAVIIGAMLISPLMGPIMLLGFSLCLLNFDAMRRALISLVAGMAGALLIAVLIVMFSPLRDATPEILARTRPNLFDLLVAIFSGLAGGYSVIHRKGATIVGVAIATALMPPLCVVGFGLATFNLVIAGGAFFLFMTNLLAIALSVTGLAWLHGFATVHAKRFARWQTLAVLVVFVGLSLPLGFALRDIAEETRATNIVREQALVPFEGRGAELSDIRVVFPSGKPIQIYQTVLTHEHLPDAELALTQLYEKLLGRPVAMRLNQVLVADDQTLDAGRIRELTASSIAPLQQQLEQLDQRATTADAIRAAIPFNVQAVDINAETRQVRIIPALRSAMTLAGMREAELQLAEKFRGWDVRILPAMQALPRVKFANAAELDEAGRSDVDVIIWALRAWDVKAVDVAGYAPLGTGATARRKVALDRANTVAELLKTAGFACTAASAYGAQGQAEQERRMGQLYFESVEVAVAP